MPNSSPSPAGLIRRLLALVYDSLLLLGVAFALGVIVTIIRVAWIGTDETAYVGLPLAFHATIWLVLWTTLAGYYVYCWTRRGQTLGMKSWRLKIETPEGSYPSAAQAWKRCLLAMISTLFLGLGYLWCLMDKSRGCWHDRWSGTRVVVLPKVRRIDPVHPPAAT